MAEHSRWRRAARVVLPCLAAAMVAFIFYNSSKTGAVSGQTSQQILEALTGEAPGGKITLLETLVRKAGHVAEYALLGLLLWFCLLAWQRGGRLWAGCALLFGAVVGAADEAYQRTVPGRSGQITDVVLDTAAVLAGLALGALLVWAARKNRASKRPTKTP